MSLEQELREQLTYELTGIEGLPEIWLDALDKQDVGAFESHTRSPITAAEINAHILHFCRQATFRLAREKDQLRTAGAEGDALG
jgi:hypothetical protein